MQHLSGIYYSSYITLTESLKLLRLHRPTGAVLLLIPVMLALTQINNSSVAFVARLLIGTVAARSCGCVINDICDRKVDALVERTAQRPLAAQTLSVAWAIALVCVTAAGALWSIFWVPISAYPTLLGAIALMLLYPLTKRFFPAPQLVLGVAFASSIPCVYAFFNQPLNIIFYQLVITVILWVISYDTVYALADFEDDKKLPIYALTKTLGRSRSVLLSQLLLIIVQISITSLIYQRFYHSHIAFGAVIAFGGSWLLTLNMIASMRDNNGLKIFERHAFLGGLWVIALSNIY